jgi:hypothetical protein
LLVAATVLALGVSTSIGAVPAAATATALPDGVDQATYARMLAQIPLDAASDQIQRAAARPGAGHDGFVETSVDTNQRSVTVYWHGPLPADISQIIDTTRHQVTVKVASARFSLSELNAAVSAGMNISGATSGHRLADGSGIELDFDRSAKSVSANDLTARVGVPVQTGVAISARQTATCIPTGQPALPAPSRCDDQPLFWGGDVTINDNTGAECSTAFGVHNAAGRKYLLTAAHCSEDALGHRINGIPFSNGDLTQFMGNSVFVPGQHDAALIPTASGNRYYDGQGVDFPGADTHNSKRVVGWALVANGDEYCVSGAFGGVSCGWFVVAVDEGNLGPGCPGSGFAEVISTNGSFIEPGDSGGPVFALAGSGVVSARGVIDCSGFDSNGRDHVIFTPMSVVKADTGATVNT